MDLKKQPHLKPDFILEETDGEYSVIHPSVTTSLYLNDSGALIWELCDGNRRISDIIALLEEAYPNSANQIAHDVVSVISLLKDKNIIDLLD